MDLEQLRRPAPPPVERPEIVDKKTFAEMGKDPISKEMEAILEEEDKAESVSTPRELLRRGLTAAIDLAYQHLKGETAYAGPEGERLVGAIGNAESLKSLWEQFNSGDPYQQAEATRSGAKMLADNAIANPLVRRVIRANVDVIGVYHTEVLKQVDWLTDTASNCILGPGNCNYDRTTELERLPYNVFDTVFPFIPKLRSFEQSVDSGIGSFKKFLGIGP